MFKSCKVCRKVWPEYMVTSYQNIHPPGICPMCGLKLTNRIKRLPPETPFSDQDLNDLYNEAVEFRKSIKQNWGGFMINPPEHCPKRFRAKDGGEWTDLAHCQSTCHKNCDRYKMFSLMTREERTSELQENGVINC